MLFLCFSSGDRYSIVESVLYHLKNYGIKVWYDYHTLILGDDKIKENIDNGVEKSNYVIWILSPNFYNCECGHMELKSIKYLYEIGKIHIFPILYNVTASELPCEYNWVKNLIYNELTDSTPSLPTCNQIVCKILKDEIESKKFVPLDTMISNDNYINILLKQYFRMDESNINSKITILYCIYEYICVQHRIEGGVLPHRRILEQLYKQTNLNLPITFKELIIAEYALTIMINERNDLFENTDC